MQPETGAHFTEITLDSLVKLVTEHRKYKQIPVGDVDADIQHQMCLSLGPQWCKDVTEWYPDQLHTPDQDQFLAATKAAITWLANGAEVVSIDELNRRAAICRGCPFNRAPHGCMCGALHSAVAAAVPESRRVNGLRSCAVCGCSLTAKAQLPAVALAAANEGKQYPSWCWQNAVDETSPEIGQEVE